MERGSRRSTLCLGPFLDCLNFVDGLGTTVVKRILVVDDHPIIREGVKRLASLTDMFVVAAETGDGNEALDLMRREDWDLVVLDISLPGRSGLEVLAQIRKEKTVPVLIFTVHPEHLYAIRAFKAGASGYISKDRSAEEVLAAMVKVSQGGRYVDVAFAEYLVKDWGDFRGRAPHETLSNREYQIMTMIARGRSVKQIADELTLSVKTVSAHKSRILSKMNMRSNGEITYYSIKNGLV